MTDTILWFSGAPNTGKTPCSKRIGEKFGCVLHTDNFVAYLVKTTSNQKLIDVWKTFGGDGKIGRFLDNCVSHGLAAVVAQWLVQEIKDYGQFVLVMEGYMPHQIQNLVVSSLITDGTHVWVATNPAYHPVTTRWR